jgi:hypothetical protein
LPCTAVLEFTVVRDDHALVRGGLDEVDDGIIGCRVRFEFDEDATSRAEAASTTRSRRVKDDYHFGVG